MTSETHQDENDVIPDGAELEARMMRTFFDGEKLNQEPPSLTTAMLLLKHADDEGGLLHAVRMDKESYDLLDRYTQSKNISWTETLRRAARALRREETP